MLTTAHRPSKNGVKAFSYFARIHMKRWFYLVVRQRRPRRKLRDRLVIYRSAELGGRMPHFRKLFGSCTVFDEPENMSKLFAHVDVSFTADFE